MILPLLPLLLAFPADNPVKIDNQYVRVIAAVDQPHHPGALHRHAVNRVMVYLDAGNQELRYQDGRVEKQHWNAGQAAWSPAGGLHVSENVGSTPLRIIEIELKKPTSQAPSRNPKLDPVAIDPQHNILLFENSQVRVFRSWREAGGTEMMHEHLGVGKVGVFLTDFNSPDTHVHAGDVTWSGPLVHETHNLGPGKMEMIVVEVF